MTWRDCEWGGDSLGVQRVPCGEDGLRVSLVGAWLLPGQLPACVTNGPEQPRHIVTSRDHDFIAEFCLSTGHCWISNLTMEYQY